MFYAMLLAHLLGDYILQTGFIVRWKTRSLAGVLAHGGIVTLATLACAALVDPSWWPYALLIGLSHTAIDVVRARLVHTRNPTPELIWYLLDQITHVAVLWVAVAASGEQVMPEPTHAARLLASPEFLLYAIGYALLANPAWVFLRLTVRGIWGPDAAPHLDAGEKYGPMIERMLIATCVMLGQFHLVPLVLLPRRLTPVRIQGRGVGVLVKPIPHWAETALSALLAIGIGLALRFLNTLGVS